MNLLRNVNNHNTSFLHLNIASLPFHIDKLQTLLTSANTKFDIIGISASKLQKNQEPLNNINIPGYNLEQLKQNLLEVVLYYISTIK